MEIFILIIFFLFISIILSLSFFKSINNRKLNQLKLQLFFAEIEKLPQIRNFAYNVLKNACATEGVFFYEVPDIIINKECNCESDRSIGLYSYMENKTLKELHELTKHNLIDWSELQNQYDSYNLYFPKIQINIESEYYKNFDICHTLAHELGHHIIHINNEEQSENLADKYSVEIFKKYLPKCFLAISCFMLQVRLNTEKPIISNFKEYYKDYLTFRDNYPELKLPLFKG